MSDDALPQNGEKSERDGAASASANDRYAIIDHIYQVAVDPERYETLLDLWEEKIAPFRRSNAVMESASFFEDFEIEGHAERAGMVLERVNETDRASALAAIVSAINPSAAFILDQGMRIISANNSAGSIFNARLSEPISNLNIEPEQCEKLKLEAEDILKSQTGKTSVIRFRTATSGRTIVFRLRKLALAGESEDFVLAVSSELSWPQALSPTMQEAFGLTAAEMEIVRAITEGSSLKDIAEQRSRSLETVKTQLRSALSKTEAHTQSELVRLTLSLMDVVSATESTQAGHLSPENTYAALKPTQYIARMMPDGRRADHLVLGDPKGRPLLYLPLDYGLTRWPASAEAHAEANGIKVIVPIRPGYGHSTNVRHHSELTDTVVNDTISLLDHYDVSSCPVICLSADSFFAYNIHQQHPGRLSAILNCAPGFPMFLPQQYERMEKWHRFILANARYAPKILPFMVKAGFSLARRIGKRGFVHAVYGNSPSDVAAFENPEVYEAMVTGSEVCLSDWHSAHQAFSNEVIVQQIDWSELLHNCDLPIHVWHGDDDPQVPPASMEEIKAEFTKPVYHHIEKAGQLLFFAYWREVLEVAEDYLAK